MRKNWKNKGIWAGLLMLVWLVGCSSDGKQQKQGPANPNDHAGHDHETTGKAGQATEYTCPMHPQIVQNEPGSCPICGMDLVKKVQPDAGDSVAVDADLNALLQPTNALVVANVATVQPERRTESVSLTANGIVTYDTRRLYTIPARFGGRIEKLYVRYAYQPIRKGQKLLELYSPDLVTAQRELLYLLEADGTNTPLIAAARQKLRLLGLTNRQIDEVVKRRQPNYSLAVFSPYDGYVVESSSSAPAPAMPAPSGGGTSAGGMTGGSMGGSGADEVVFSAPPSAPASTAVADGALPIREGQYVQTGQTLFQVVNPTRLWAEFRLYAQDAARLKPGTPLTISFTGGGTPIQRARVDFVVPFFASGGTDASSQFVTIRAYLSGANGPRVGQLAKATLRQPVPNALWIPATAVLELGTERVAFVKEGGAFRPVRVQTGAQSGTLVAITRGLTEGQAIARNAQFLIDSESFVNVTPTTP